MNEPTSQTSDSTTKPPEHSRKEVWKMFDRIAHKYDFLNRALSFGQDIAWRKKMRSFLPQDKPLELLDLATGTGDQIFFLLDGKAAITDALGLDLSEGMLEHGRTKVKERGLEDKMRLETGDAMNVPVDSESKDVVTISFGIRNVTHVPTSLKEMLRVLRPGGRVQILEASLPANKVVRAFYLFYFRKVLPLVGGWISGDSYAYRYLNETVETFPCGEDFCQLMRDAGFENVHFKAMTFGIASIYIGDRPGDAN